MDKRTCIIDGCESRAIGRGWCSKHYYRWKRNGDPLLTTRAPHGSTLDQRLRHTGWTVTESGCWVWNGATRNEDGYGATTQPGSRNMLAHRAAYIAWVGPIPDEAIVLHSCDNPPCINPEHLRVGTDADNSDDKIAKNRHAFGERAGSVKLTDEQVEAIRARYAAGGISQRALAAEYGVWHQHISSLVRFEKRKKRTR